MFSTLVNNERIIISILLFQLMKIPAMTIYNGFSVKFKNSLSEGGKQPKTFASLFEKNPTESISEYPQVFPQTAETLRSTRDIAKILFPTSFNLFNKTNKIREKKAILNLPILKELNETYKIIVVKAPSTLKIGGPHHSSELIVYIVFSEDDNDDPENIKIPQIYFVNKKDGYKTIEKRESIDPVIIVNNNRTVTGLRSTEVSKYVKFKSKRANRMDIENERNSTGIFS